VAEKAPRISKPHQTVVGKGSEKNRPSSISGSGEGNHLLPNLSEIVFLLGAIEPDGTGGSDRQWSKKRPASVRKADVFAALEKKEGMTVRRTDSFEKGFKLGREVRSCSMLRHRKKRCISVGKRGEESKPTHFA